MWHIRVAYSPAAIAKAFGRSHMTPSRPYPCPYPEPASFGGGPFESLFRAEAGTAVDASSNLVESQDSDGLRVADRRL